MNKNHVASGPLTSSFLHLILLSNQYNTANNQPGYVIVIVDANLIKLFTDFTHAIKVVQQAVKTEALLTENNNEASNSFEHFGHDDGRCREEHVTRACPCISHDENQTSILYCQNHKTCSTQNIRPCWKQQTMQKAVYTVWATATIYIVILKRLRQKSSVWYYTIVKYDI